MPLVTAINSSTGATVADEVSFSSATSITVKFILPVDGTYKLYIENPDGNAVQTGAVLTVSDAPAWVTSAGSLGSFSGGSSFGTITLTATNSVSMAVVSGTLPGGMTLNSGSGSSTLTGTESGATADTTYSFTIRATDAEGQTADRAFTITITLEQIIQEDLTRIILWQVVIYLEILQVQETEETFTFSAWVRFNYFNELANNSRK